MSKTSTTNSARRSRSAPAKPRAATTARGVSEQAARAYDADNPPITRKRLASLRPVPRVKTLRRALELTQEEFAARYAIPLGTLRDWEQGRSEPDQPARAYLLVIANDPEGVATALSGKTRR